MPVASSWPMFQGFSGPAVDAAAVCRAAAGDALHDDTWVPLIAAVLSFAKLGKKERDALAAALRRHAPTLEGFGAAMAPPKACAQAVSAGLDLTVFARAMLGIEPMKGAPAALKHLPGAAVFELLCEHHTFELRVAGKSLPVGLSRLRALHRLTLLGADALRTADHVSELAELPQRVSLTLAFDGRPPFALPNLGLLTSGRFSGLAFATPGTPVDFPLEALTPLATWRDLDTLSLRGTSLARGLTRDALSRLHALAPTVRTLILTEAVPGDWRGTWPGLDLRLGADARSAP